MHGGPLTPEDAFLSVKSAMHANDYGAISDYISSASEEKIRRFISLLATLDNERLQYLASYYRIDPSRLKSIDFNSALALYFNETGDRVSLQTFFNSTVTAIDVKGERAVLRVKEGFEVDFVREGPYWKLDLTGL